MPNYPISPTKAMYRKAGGLRFKRKTKHKPYRSKNYMGPKPIVGSWPRGIPDRLFTTLKYRDNYVLSATSPALAIQAWNLNSAYDFDLTGTGHQPLYFDQLCGALEGAALFHKYRVHAVEYTIRLMNNDANTPVTVVVVPVTHNNTIVSTDDMDALCEAPYARKRQLCTGNAGSNVGTIKGTVSIKQLEGEKELSSNSWSAVHNASPTAVSKLYCVAESLDSGENVAEVHVEASFKIKLELFDRIYRSSTD